MKKKNQILLAVIFSIAIAFFALYQGRGVPSSEARIYVSPASVESTTLSPFWINITVYNVTNMASCEFNITYTPRIFAITQVLKNQVNGQYPKSLIYVDGTNGYIYANLTYKSPVTLPQKEAALLSLELTPVDYGSTPLVFSKVSLKDPSGNAIPYQSTNGFVWIIKHDVAVINVATSTNETYAGRQVQIDTTVQNMGNIAENITLNLYANKNLITSVYVNNLQVGEMRIISFIWNTSNTAASNTPYPISAEIPALPLETNVANNALVDGSVKLKIIGDVNGDGTVDVNDLFRWDLAFNSKSGDANWNPQADINGDGIVDKEDGVLIIENYHNTL